MSGRRTWLLAALGCLASGILASCGGDDTTRPRAGIYPEIIEQFGLTPLPDIPYPSYNLYQEDRILLGRLLFFDPILSGEAAPWVQAAAGRTVYRDRRSDVACGTCHHPAFGFADGNRLGIGVGGGSATAHLIGPARVPTGVSAITAQAVGLEARNTPTVLNTALNGRGSPDPTPLSFQFMDGRVQLGLEQQVEDPLVDREEMAGDAYGRSELGDALTPQAVHDSVAARVRAIPAYVDRFQAAFPGEVLAAEDIELVHVAQALAAYQRELVTPGSRYDRFVAGEFSAFTPTEQDGFLLFFGKGGCGGCHFGPMLSDYSFHVQGAAEEYDEVLAGFAGQNGEGGDFGRFHADPVAFAGEKFAFRTPTLRNVADTAPYFHAGTEPTLLAVIDFYNRGGRGEGALEEAVLESHGVSRDPRIRPLALTAGEMQAVVAFLRTLTGEVPPGPRGVDLTRVPDRVPSGILPPGVPTPPGPGPFFPE